jgi:Protein of unknown function (DUF3592)
MDLIPILLSALFAFISSFCAYHCIKHAIEAIRMFRAGTSAEATVTQVKSEQRQRKGKARTIYSMVIVFETVWQEKREIDYATPLGAKVFNIGDKVKIWYDENDPAIFTLGGWYLVKDLASFFIFALCFGLPGWTLLIHYIYLFF